MIHIENKQDCCGCWACHNACPKHCIEMKEDEEGFCYPQIDTHSCIGCGVCDKVCPIVNATGEDTPYHQEGFLFQNSDSLIRRESTSGGAFTAIAAEIIHRGGIVFGAGYRPGTFIVEHQPAETIDDLRIFRNSKYVQSRVGTAYSDVLAQLRTGRPVCFSGTPCQVEGLRHFLRGREYMNLICVDLVCHGIPSPHILSLYIERAKQQIGGRFTNILFRDKHYGYHYSSMSIYNSEEKKNYHKGVDSDAYLRAFFSNLSDRPSCYSCRFKKRYRHSDITLWDCFSPEQFTDKLDGNGTTRILTHTAKGTEFINEVVAKAGTVVNVEPDKLTHGVREMFHSVPMNLQRSDFFRDSNAMAPAAFFDKWFPTTLSVRLNTAVRITCHRLGIYNVAKRIFMLFYTRRDER